MFVWVVVCAEFLACYRTGPDLKQAPTACSSGVALPCVVSATPSASVVNVNVKTASLKTTPPAAESRSENEPTRLVAANHVLEIQYCDKGFVSSIELDQERVFPIDCGNKTTGWCSPQHQKLRSFEGKGKDLRFIESATFESKAYALFAATFYGSPECGAYGYWLLKLDHAGVSVSQPLLGCFGTPNLANGSDVAVEPRIGWTKPLLVWIRHEGNQTTELFRINEPGLTWVKVLATQAER